MSDNKRKSKIVTKSIAKPESTKSSKTKLKPLRLSTSQKWGILVNHVLKEAKFATISDTSIKEEDWERLRYKEPPPSTDLLDLIENRVKNFRDDSFLYLKFTAPRSSIYYTPFALLEAPYSSVNKSEYYTVSRHGVTYWSDVENHFTKLDVWVEEYKVYLGIKKLKTFKKYRLWKSFTVWRKAIVWSKYAATKEFFENNLYFLSPALAEAAMLFRDEHNEFLCESFVDATATEDLRITNFIELQEQAREKAIEKIKSFWTRMKLMLYNACNKALEQKGFFAGDEATIPHSAKKPLPKMSYIERAKKRRYCNLISHFINLCDYLTVTFLHAMLHNSFQELATIFKIHDELGPSKNDLQNSSLYLQVEPPRQSDNFRLPLISGDLILDTCFVGIDPQEEVVNVSVMNFIKTLEKCVFDVLRFHDDDIFNRFTEPTIMGRKEDRFSVPVPSLEFRISINPEININKKLVATVIERAYEKSKLYIQRFESLRMDYQKDVEMNRADITEEKNLDVLRSLCGRFTKELKNLEGIVPEIYLGLLKFNQSTFRSNVTPVCTELLDILYVYIPSIAIKEVRRLFKKAKDVMSNLTAEPDNTSSYVDYLHYIDSCNDEIAILVKEIDYAYNCFMLIKDFEINVDQDDKEAFMDCEDIILEAKEVLLLKLDKRQQFVDKLDICLQEDIKLLFEGADEIKELIVKEWLIDVESEIAEVKEYLQDLYDKIANLQAIGQSYRGYQREFKIDLTRFTDLDLTCQLVKYRQQLWESLEQWTDNMRNWKYQQFSTLNVSDMSEITENILKNCAFLEKNLPPNKIIPQLRADASIFKKKLPIIEALRRPGMKARHWILVEQATKLDIRNNPLISLDEFEAVDIYGDAISEAIIEVSNQANNEASLENLLKKVENAWEGFELVIVPHRDSTDVFILAGTDELQVLIDESNININTIAASRYVAPIKGVIDDWIVKLELISETLDQWTTCQISWIYLEAIFSAPDIQRQLPYEAKMFLTVDKNWKELMRSCHKMPLAMYTMSNPEVLATLKLNNELLDQITKCLEAYLEVKRIAFPRFFFLSNDELLEILAQTRNPHAVQPHLRKCFDAIARLEFGYKEGPDGPIQTTDIIAMISPEGEKITFGRGLKARGPVEDWLGKVELAMFSSLKRYMKYSYMCYAVKDRSEWFQEHPNQVVLTVSQQQWAIDVHVILDNEDKNNVRDNMLHFKCKLQKDLTRLAQIARTDITSLMRKVLCALITVDVHNMDTITNLCDKNVDKSTDFDWLKMLRYYWLPLEEVMVTRMSSACLPYFYEYLGAGGVLVITPLTDRCYLCLMGALQMDLGGAPAGPAGTGKTETTKDLAKALAKQCVVFNCSEGLDYKMMGRFFSGLATSGAWCCFDEFNRIDIEVLSVIAQQLITIRNAKAKRQQRFLFEGREIKLNMSCAAFITMNPGYAGRTELPDNLKALFRPIAMMVPDYALIAEVILYSEGFEASKVLAKKMVQMYKHCSEQLSQQDHYDFGMRAVKSVLVRAGALKRASPNQQEDVTLIVALRDSNVPKFLSEDVVLFNGILGDLFPGVKLPVVDYGVLQDAIEHCMKKKKLQVVPDLVNKTIQLFETMCVRWGVMLVGPTGGGKSSVLNTLACALTKLWEDGVSSPYYRNVRIQTLNPKAVSLDELYGAVNLATMEWKDGLLGTAVRTAVNVVDEEHQWVVNDGPVDAVWIENLNTVLDDNKMLCLANSERIKLTEWVHMVFEVADLAQASPATVSRCGMVYVDPGELKWMPLVLSWKETLSESRFQSKLMDYLIELFERHFEKFLKFSRRKCRILIDQVDVSKVSMMCTLVRRLILMTAKINSLEEVDAKKYVLKLFAWASLWSIGGNVIDESRVKLEIFVKENLAVESGYSDPVTSIWDLRLDVTDMKWEKWDDIVEPFVFNMEMAFFDMLVSTTDTVKYGYISELLFREQHPVMFSGDTGVGKTILATAVLKKLSDLKTFVPVTLNFSAQTSSIRTQMMIEARLDKRKRTLLGPPIDKKMVIFVDDVNMPKLDTYGSQPPIELLRQILDYKGFFDRDKLFWKGIIDVVLGCGCAPPGGGRNPLTPRFVRHFALLLLSPPKRNTLTTIFSAIIKGFFNEFCAAIRPIAEPVVNAAVDLYIRIAEELLPTPVKSHYVFNLRDLAKCAQGILQADPSSYSTPKEVERLFYHEAERVFHDRLINTEDKSYFKSLMEDICIKYFDNPIVNKGETMIFGDFMIFGQAREERFYEEVKDMNKLRSILYDYLEDYNGMTGKAMKLILFQDAIEHVTRLARLLRTARGNGLLVGLSGMGKQSLSRLGAHINGYKCKQIELSRGYDYASFHEDLRAIYWQSGVLNTPTVFLMTDTQIIREEFLEDINNILNSGEVPGLYEADEYENVILGMRDQCAAAKYPDCTRDGIYNFYIQRVRANLHIVLCMSPIGDAFRRRCRMFPSLVNCCTIDWFVKWPQEALYSVAVGSLQEKSEDVAQCEAMSKICVTIHESVETASDQFLSETRRHYYTTPSSYLELLKLYHSLVKQRTEILIAKRSRIANGLSKILETNDVVAVMTEELALMQPKLEEQSAVMKELVSQLDNDQKAADVVKNNVQKDEVEAQAKALVTQTMADEAAADLEVAMPALRAAQEALNSITKSDINEMKSFITPPRLVQFVMESVCILFGVKPTWDSAKKIMADVNFLKRLIEFDKENITEATIKKVKVYIDDKDFDPAKIEKVSKVAKSVCLWVIAMEKFSKVYKVVEPKIKAQKEAERELKEVMKILKQKQAELAQVEAKLQALSDALAVKNSEFKVIQDEVDLTNGRLNRAGRLTSALSDEEIRWSETVKILTNELWAIPGDVLVAAACVAYLGAFSTSYRRNLCKMWVAECQKYEIPSSKEFNLIAVLGDAYEIRNWNMHYLPRDEVSTENGIIVSKALRWPLMIDPQEQANRWIRSLEGPNDLRIIKMTDPNLIRILEICIRQGFPILIEELDETIDPTLDPILKRLTYVSGGRLLIRLGDTDIDYDNNFRLYMTTKLSNPHYLPEVCVTVTLVNFLVTTSGLEDQLLADVVAIELPQMEKQRTDLIVQINNDRQQLLLLEDKILKLLYASKGNILDDEELVETLNESKETSAIIAARLIDTEKTEAVISETREKYRILAQRGATLFFVVASLADIDPMYQYSLKYFKSVFCSVIEAVHPPLALKERLEQLMADEVYALYINVSRGLFEKHKMIYSFLLAVAVEKQCGVIGEKEFNFLVRGPVGIQPKKRIKPHNLQLTDSQFQTCQSLEHVFGDFIGILDYLEFKITLTIDDVVEELYFLPNSENCPVDWDQKLNNFQKLILINAVKDHKLVAAMGGYVRATLGKHFTEAGGSSLASLYEDTNNVTPLIFILSTGSDPMAAFMRFAEDMKFTDKLNSISLGQGQGPAAEALIEQGRTAGEWVFLQNCHLATSWMKNMEEIIKALALGTLSAHADFRLYLSSMPTRTFPVSVLQNSVKVTNEPPKGIKANLKRALDDLSEDYFEQHALGNQWRAMVFGVCMFHGVILERRKFGPLGWNITYEFNESDRESGLRTLDMYCDREEVQPIPWVALEYINGQITWGGRVTDYWDQRCLSTILKVFSSPQILSENYAYCESGKYRSPDGAKLSAFKEYVNELPFLDDPDIFGMHENANLVFQRNETHFFLTTLLTGMPREGGGDGDGSVDDIVLRQLTHIEKSLAVKILSDEPHPALLELDSKGRMPSLSTVLFQETERFNNLLNLIHWTLKDLRKAIKGLVVMSESLEAVFVAFLNNQVPEMWAAKGFLSTKSLGKWVFDFQLRIDYIQNWMNCGLPKSSWISGLFFPQSFLTGILQTHARQTNIPIDDLKIDFEITPYMITQDRIYQNRNTPGADSFDGLEHSDVGTVIHGLFIEAARWNGDQGGLVDSLLGELTPSLPAVYLKPCTELDVGKRYESPLYKTQVRAGVLSTTGHSTNFVLTVLLPSLKSPDFWILRGTALVTSITE